MDKKTAQDFTHFVLHLDVVQSRIEMARLVASLLSKSSFEIRVDSDQKLFVSCSYTKIVALRSCACQGMLFFLFLQ